MSAKKNTRKQTERPYSSMQLWPGGKTVHVSGERKRMLIRYENGETWRKPTPEEYRAVRVEQMAESYLDRDLLCCDSMLVSSAIQSGYESSGEFAREWDMENVKNLRPNASDWNLEQCKEWLEDNGHDLPDPNPWAMDRAAMVELFPSEDYHTRLGQVSALTDDDLRTCLIEDINDESTDGIEAWRDAVRDNADDAEIYQWFRVTDWLASKLDGIGECVMDNAYGQWWGRQCCGQAVIMDGTLQKIAAQMFDQYPE